MKSLRNRVSTLIVPELLAVLAALCVPACSGSSAAMTTLPSLAPSQAGDTLTRGDDLVSSRLGAGPRTRGPQLFGNASPGGPGRAAGLEPYDPAPGTYALFPTSIFHQRIPANPSVNPNSAAWLGRLGTLGFGHMQFAANAAGLAQDYSFPIYPMSASAAGTEAVKVHCTEPWGTCNVEGKTVSIDPRELPENGTARGEDSHMALVDAAAGKEYDFWATQWPPTNGVLDIGWGGTCTLSGDGYDGCSATATSTPLSVGIIRAKDLMLALRSPSGSLPYALQATTKCSDGSIAPMLGGDGHTPGCAPQGSRVYLAMHDAQVDATANSPLGKALLRTIDEDHFGMIVTDTNGGQDGFGLVAESDLTYTSFGAPGPFVSEIVPEAKAEGLQGTTPYNNVYYLQMPMSGIDFASKLKFL